MVLRQADVSCRASDGQDEISESLQDDWKVLYISGTDMRIHNE